MSVKIMYYVHSKTTDNELHVSSGWKNVELSPKGIEQSFALKEKVPMDKIDVVFCSDLKRAVVSANNIFGGVKEIIEDSRIRECNYGDLDGKDTSLVKYEEHIQVPFPNGESLKDVEERIKDFLNSIKEKYDGKTVALVAHKAPQLAIEVLTMNKTWDEAIATDWRKTKAWRPGWEYEVK